MVLKRYICNFLRLMKRKRNYVMLLVAVAVLCVYRKQSRTIVTATKYNMRLMLFGERSLPEPTQNEIDYYADKVRLKYTVLDNFLFDNANFYIASLSLINTGSHVIPAKRWQLYGYFATLAEQELYPYPYGVYIRDSGLRMFHVAGGLFRFEPVGGFFEEILPGKNLTFKLKFPRFSVARTDSLPNWYVTGTDLSPRIIANTKSEELSFVSDFRLPEQYLRRPTDRDVPYSPVDRYWMYLDSKAAGVSGSNIIPTPLEAEIDALHKLEWSTSTWVVIKSSVFAEEVKYLSTTMKMKVVASRPMRKFVELVEKPVEVKQGLPDEAYVLESDPSKQWIRITARTNKAAFYAIQTLKSLVFTPEAETDVGVSVNIPAFKIRDAPRFSYRGLHIDVSRNFQSVDQMKKIMDAMATYKMNKLHLHLSDDEGWRLEIPGLPELTQIGSRRCHDPDEEQCIVPLLGSGPYANTSGSGYYDVGSYKALLSYAKSLHIDVIPEFDMPGHSRAAIKSVHAKSQKSYREKMKVQQYDIIDAKDKSVYKSGQHFTDDVMNPCIDSTYKFVNKVMTEVKEMHKDIQPLKFYHFGGDEVAKGAWSGSPACKQLQRDMPELETEYDLMKHFVRNVAGTAAGNQISLGTWEDGMISHGKDADGVGVPFARGSFKNEDIYVYVWKLPREPRTPHRARLFVNYGYKVVLSYAKYLYFDHPYEPDPEERGLYWATRKISTRDAWDFSPGVMHNDIDLACPVTDSSDCYHVKAEENVVGMQAQLWSETVRTADQMDYMLFPRLLAVAERAWHKASWEDDVTSDPDKAKQLDWINFINIVGNKELRRLDRLGVMYRVPPPGAIVKDGKVKFATEFPGLDIEFYSATDDTWKPVSHEMPISDTLFIRTRSPDGKRYSRVIAVEPWDTPISGSAQKHVPLPLIFIFILLFSYLIG